MSDGADEFRRLEADATSATASALPNIKKAVGIAALKGKKAWQGAISAGPYLRAYKPSIDYDPVGSDYSTDLGPNLGGRGAGGLGIVEDAPGGVNGAPQRNYIAAEEVMGPDLEKGVLLAIDEALRRSGL